MKSPVSRGIPPRCRPGRLGATLFLIAATVATASAQTLSFPGALGYGSSTSGGRGDTVYHVTNLNDSGTGSFRTGVGTSGRTIVFDVGGYIHALSPISVASNITIAGQTAPGDGIGVYGCEVSYTGSSNDITRFFRFRDGTQDPNYPGASSTNSHTNAVNLGTTTNMIFDHCSFEFAAYNNVDAVDAVNITFQDCIFANPIKEQQFNCHFETGPATFINNLWANAHNRNPLGKANLQYLDNVVYNYQAGFTAGNTSGKFSYDILNNYFVAGPSTTSASDDYFQVPSNCSAYATGNLVDGNVDGVLNGSSANSAGGATVLTAPWNSGSTALATAAGETKAADVFKYVASNAGPLPLDQVDAQIQGNVLSLGKTGMLWTTETSTGLGNGGYGVLNGGIPLPDSDGDGMPDVWENAVGLNPNSASDGTTVTSSGYTNLEVYLNWLCAPHGIVYKNTSAQPSSLDIDLSQYTKGYTVSPTFSVSGATNGTVTLAADGHTAHFVPTLNFSGLGSYNFSVTDGVSTMTQTVGVLVSATSPPVDVTWYGDNTTNAWDTSSLNWLAPNGSFIAFGAGDGVTFDDTGSVSPAIALSGSLAPSEVEVNSNQNNFTFSGTGLLTGSMELVKNGNSTLSINNTGTNTFTGGAILNAGNVSLGQTTGFGTGAVTLNGVGLTLPGGGGTFGNPLVVGGPSSLTWTSGSNMYLNGAVTGAANFSLNFSNRLLTLEATWAGYAGTMDTGTSTGSLRLYSGAVVNFGAATVNLGNCSMYHHGSVGQAMSFGALNGNSAAVLYGSDVAGSGGTDTVTIGALNTNSVFNGTIKNSPPTTNLIALTKTGTGTLTLGGANTYTGLTSVAGGALAVNGSLGNTAVSVTSGALYGGGTIGSTSGGAVSMASGTTLSPGSTPGTGVFGTLTVGNGLTLSSAKVALDLSSSPSGSNDKITLQGGTLTLSGTNTFALTLTDGVLGAGVYNLITGASTTSGSASNLSLGLPTGARQTFTVSTVGGVQLTVTGTAATLTWQGGQAGGLWNANSTANWSNNGVSDKFYNFDAVVFDDTSTVGTVNMSGSVQPRSTVFNNSATAYTLNGPGTLDGTGTLTKNGTGTLTINCDFLVSATTSTSSTTVTVTATTGMFVGQAVTGTSIPAGTTVASLVDATHITLSQTPTVAGTSSLTFYTVNSYSGGTVINAGTIALGSFAANAAGLGTGAVTLNGGTLTMYSAGNGTDAGTLSNPLVVNTTGTLITAPRCTVASTLAGSGVLTYNTVYVRTALAGDWSAFTGQINVTGGGNFRITPSYYYAGFPLAGVHLADNVDMYFAGIVSDTGTSVPIGELSGTALSFLQGGPSSSGSRPFSWIIGGKNTNATFAGAITEQAAATTVTSINKVGTGTWTLSGASSFNGDMLIQGGTLLLSGSLTNGGACEAQSATTLQLAGGTVTTASVQIDGGATLTGCGTINGNLSSQGTVLINCGGGLTVNGDVENDGTLRLTNGSTLAVTGQFTNTGLLDLLAGTSSLPANFVNSGTVLDSSLVRAQSATRAGGVFTVTILGYATHGYQLQSTASLTAPTWQNLGSVQTVSASQSGPVTLTFQDSGASATRGFYRIVVAP